MSGRPILLDTCAALWLAGGQLADEAEALVVDAWSDDIEVLVSPITAWEVGILVAKDRLTLTVPVSIWFDTLLELGVTLAELSPAVLIASTELRASELTDPSDRIIAATARAFNYRLMTRDRPLLAYASRGQVTAIAC